MIFCMAGLYQRFRDAGYAGPKYLLPFRGRPILSHVMTRLDPPGNVLFVANQRERSFASAIQDALGGLVEYPLLFVGDTSGQAETAAIGADAARDRGWDGPVLFHNVDTILSGRDLPAIGAMLATADGVIDVFPSTSPAFSYVAVDDQQRVTGIAEKVVISPYATTGLYGFRSPSAYLEWYARTVPSGKESYISDVYRAILAAGGVIRTTSGGDTLVLGTPAEYEAAT